MGDPKLVSAWFVGFGNFLVWGRLVVAGKRSLGSSELAGQLAHWLSLNQQGWKMQEATAAKRHGGLTCGISGCRSFVAVISSSTAK